MITEGSTVRYDEEEWTVNTLRRENNCMVADIINSDGEQETGVACRDLQEVGAPETFDLEQARSSLCSHSHVRVFSS